MHNSTQFPLDSKAFKTAVLMVTPDDDYAAIFEYGEQIAVLRSQAGRCVLSYPMHQRGGAEKERERFKAIGFVQQHFPVEDFSGFLTRFMQVAGFTSTQLMQTLSRSALQPVALHQV